MKQKENQTCEERITERSQTVNKKILMKEVGMRGGQKLII
jgi:hypothetical protein